MSDAALTPDTIVEAIAQVFAAEGSRAYLGEQVTMAQHMLQAAACAERAGAPDAEVAAALLHDIGHFTNVIPHKVLAEGRDNLHEDAGAAFLAPFFPPEVVDPVRHHVAAKRYLCTVKPDYLDRLSAASVHTLNLQGGTMTDAEARAFAANPHLDATLRVRVWDDQGKDPAMPHPDFDHYRPLLERLVVRG
ncbi:MAG: HD domain-containing protein [Rhodobacterales bacterium]|nr:HD domain-containing protein [Rhodobacterales bacterium]